MAFATVPAAKDKDDMEFDIAASLAFLDMADASTSDSHSERSFCPNASEQHGGSQDAIQKAQLEAESMRSRFAGRSMRLLGPKQMTGVWADCAGSTVTVSASTHYRPRLTAVFQRPGRRDIILALKPKSGGGWTCGEATMASGSEMEVWWVFPSGSFSMWSRVADVPNQASAAVSHVSVPMSAPAPAPGAYAPGAYAGVRPVMYEAYAGVRPAANVWMPVYMPA